MSITSQSNSNEQQHSRESFSQQDQFLSHNDEIDLKHLWLIIYRHKWRIIALSIVVTLLATIFAYSKTPIYVASTTVLIEQEQGKVLQLSDVYNESSSREEFYYTQLEIIGSTRIAKKVVEDLDLVNHPLFNQPVKTDTSWFSALRKKTEPKPLTEKQKEQVKFNQALYYILGNTSASPISKTEMVVISFESSNPEFAAMAANAVAKAYIDSHMEVNVEEVEKSAAWLNRSLSGLKNKLDISEDKLQDFEEDNSLVDLGGVKRLAAKEIEDASDELLQARQEQKQMAQVYDLLQENRNNPEALANLPDVLNHPNIKQINQRKRDVESEILELSVIYGPKHPRMRTAYQELDKVHKNILTQIDRLIASIGSDYRKATRKTEQAQISMAAAKNKYQKLSRVDNLRRELSEDVDTNRDLYQAFFTRLKENTELQGFEASIGRITEPATVPFFASKPNRRLIIVLALILSGMFGVGATLLLEAFNSTIRSVDDVEGRLHKNLLGIVPIVAAQTGQKTKKLKKGRLPEVDLHHYFNGNDHAFSEALRTLRTSLQLLNLEKKTQVIVLTSTVPGEGKTMVASNLAFAVGQLEKTLLIDTDLRKPKVAKNFKLTNKVGLSNYIAGSNTLEECINHDEQSGVDIISAGTIPPNPQELLASNQFKLLVNELKGSYDRIIIDTPPILAVSDAIIVGKLADSLIYVVKNASTKESHIKGSLKRLAQSNIKVSGVVLNQVDLKKAHEYEEFSGYYDQYGYNT